MTSEDSNWRSAVEFIRANAIDGRSLSREHLVYLVNSLHIPTAKLAELLRVPRWFMARKVRRLGFLKRRYPEKDPAAKEFSEDDLPTTTSAAIKPQANHDHSSQDNNNHEAERYIITHAINGISISRGHLKHLVSNLNIPIEQLAGMLNCHKEILARKAHRWRLKYKEGECAQPEATDFPPTAFGRTPKKYASAYARAKSYLAGLDLERQRRPTEGDLRYFYHDLQLPLAQVAQLFNCSEAAVRLWMRKANLASRKNSETRTGHYNVAFFRDWSPAMAWVVGLIYTDGYLKRTSVSLASMDRELLEKVRVLVAPQHTILKQRQSYDWRRTINKFEIHHRGMVADLQRIGLQERKSLVMEFPDIPTDYTRHFIRGCWDGDGGFGEASGKVIAHYTCGSFDFIRQLSAELYKAGITREILRRNSSESPEDFKELITTYGRSGPFPPTIYKRKGSNAYDLRIGSRNGLRRLFDYFYKDVDSAIFLVRKYQKLKQYVEAGNELQQCLAILDSRE